MTISNPLIYDLSTTGLEPVKDRIIGITIKTKKEEKIITDRSEQMILFKFWAYIEKMKPDKIIGFNNEEFDDIMLKVRSVKYQVQVPKISDKFMDLRKIIFNGKEKRRGTLQDFQNFLGIIFPETRYSKHDMSLLWETPDLHNLKEFLLQDVRTTWLLYEQLKEAKVI